MSQPSGRMCAPISVLRKTVRAWGRQGRPRYTLVASGAAVSLQFRKTSPNACRGQVEAAVMYESVLLWDNAVVEHGHAGAKNEVRSALDVAVLVVLAAVFDG